MCPCGGGGGALLQITFSSRDSSKKKSYLHIIRKQKSICIYHDCGTGRGRSDARILWLLVTLTFSLIFSTATILIFSLSLMFFPCTCATCATATGIMWLVNKDKLVAAGFTPGSQAQQAGVRSPAVAVAVVVVVKSIRGTSELPGAAGRRQVLLQLFEFVSRCVC